MAMDFAEPDPWRHLAGLQQVAEGALPHARSTVALLATLLDRLTQAGGCVGGLVWSAEPGRREPLVSRFRSPTAPEADERVPGRPPTGAPPGVPDQAPDGSLARQDWAALLGPLAMATALAGPQSVALSAGSAAGWLVAVPLPTGESPPLWLALLFEARRGARPVDTPQARASAGGEVVERASAEPVAPARGLGPVPAGWVDFTCAVGDLATLSCVKWQRDQLVRRQVADRQLEARVESLYAALTASRSPTDFLAAVQTAFGADRAWLLEVVRETPRLRASSLPRVDAHADRQLVLLKELAGLVAGGRAPLRGEAGSGMTGGEDAGRVQARLLEYLDLSRNRRVELIPLAGEPSQPPAVLVLDYFTGAARESFLESVSTEATSNESRSRTAQSASTVARDEVAAERRDSGRFVSPDLATEGQERLLRHVALGWSWLRERGTGSWLTRLSRGLGLQGEPPRWRLA
ncbi:MAG: hypothetical protein ACKOGA_06565, partial [Planctomycetaceae bacterium]